MQIYYISDADTLLGLSPCAIALGNFDGVHIGHTALLGATLDAARKHGLTSAVFTFLKHPATVLADRSAPSLTTIHEKVKIFEKLGFERVFFADFAALRDYTPERFVSEILCERTNARLVVCGESFRFGRHGAGDPAYLSELMGGKVVIFPPVRLYGEDVSSTRIRASLECGETELANEMLGRPFSIDFPVLHGKELGRTIGVPTINQSFPSGHIIPARGVYACKVMLEGVDYPAVANVGFRPTVELPDRINCETHIIGYKGWLYGRRVKVSFYKRLRDERRFDSLDELAAHIALDIEQVKDYFETERSK